MKTMLFAGKRKQRPRIRTAKRKFWRVARNIGLLLGTGVLLSSFSVEKPNQLKNPQKIEQPSKGNKPVIGNLNAKVDQGTEVKPPEKKVKVEKEYICYPDPETATMDVFVKDLKTGKEYLVEDIDLTGYVDGPALDVHIDHHNNIIWLTENHVFIAKLDSVEGPNDYVLTLPKNPFQVRTLEEYWGTEGEKKKIIAARIFRSTDLTYDQIPIATLTEDGFLQVRRIKRDEKGEEVDERWTLNLDTEYVKQDYDYFWPRKGIKKVSIEILNENEIVVLMSGQDKARITQMIQIKWTGGEKFYPGGPFLVKTIPIEEIDSQARNIVDFTYLGYIKMEGGWVIKLKWQRKDGSFGEMPIALDTLVKPDQ